MHEDEHVELLAFGPERLVVGRIEEFAISLRRDHDALKPQFMPAAVELFQRRRPAERMRMGGADEAARIVAFGLPGPLVANLRTFKIGCHAGGACEPGGVNPSRIHHPDVLIEIIEERMHGVARRSVLVVAEDEPIAWIVLDELAWREVVLEIDDHREVPVVVGDFYLFTAYAPSRSLQPIKRVIPGRRSEAEASPDSILPDLRLWIPGPRPAAEPRNDWTA